MRKPFGANLTSEPPDHFVFFIDRSLGKHAVAARLRGVGATVEIHDDHFLPDAPDSEWLGEVGRRGWLVLTKDKRIQHRAIEQSAVASAFVRLFALTGGNLTGDEMGQVLAKARRKMVAIARDNRAPFIARVYKNGSVAVVVNRRKLLQRQS